MMLKTAVEKRGLHYECIEGSLDEYLDDWDTLVSSAPGHSYATSGSWIRAFARSFTPAMGRFLCPALFRDGALVAALPLIERDCSGQKELHLPFNHNSYGVDILLAESDGDQALSMLLGLALESSPGATRIVANRLGESSPLLSVDRLEQFFIVPREREAFGAYVDTSGDFDAFLDTVNKKFRRNVQRLERKAVESCGTVKLVMSRPAEKDAAFEQFLRLESSGWKGRATTSISQDEAIRNFYWEIVDSFSKRGWIDLSFLRAGDNVVAGYIGVRFGGRLTLLKIAFDENFSSIGPGTVLMKHVLQGAFEDESINEVDCLTYFAWNSNWNMRKREYYTCRFIEKSLGNLLLEYLPLAVRLRLAKIETLRKIRNKLRGN